LNGLADASSLEGLVGPAPLEEDRAALRDRFRGVMLGLAAGNALGLPVEGESAHAIRRHHPAGVTEVSVEERDRPWDDDLAQAVILAETLFESEEFDPEDFAARLVDWARTNGRGIGGLTQTVIGELEKGRPWSEAARIAWGQNAMSNAGNGAVMRCPPVALRHLRSGVDLVRAARTSALVTHFDARCEWSTVVTSVALATCLGGEPVALHDLGTAVESVRAEGWLADSLQQVAEAVHGTEQADLKAMELDDPSDMGYTLKAMQVALWCMVQPDGFEPTVVEVVNRGGDTDTNGALAGAIMGARLGATSIPPRWLENIADTKTLTELADRLFEKGVSAG
jgi:ADP-ribosyl-[dinitrogen reductase] hydrolase